MRSPEDWSPLDQHTSRSIEPKNASTSSTRNSLVVLPFRCIRQRSRQDTSCRPTRVTLTVVTSLKPGLGGLTMSDPAGASISTHRSHSDRRVQGYLLDLLHHSEHAYDLCVMVHRDQLCYCSCCHASLRTCTNSVGSRTVCSMYLRLHLSSLDS